MGKSKPSPALRSLLARAAVHALHAQYDSTELTRPAREAARTNLDRRLLSEIDPDRSLPEAERARRLDHARKAYFALLAYRSAVSGQKRAARRGGRRDE